MWAKVDDQWWMHPKVLRLSMPARGLWVTALSYCGTRRSPHVPEAWVVYMICGINDDGHELAAELVDAGLWDKHEDGDGWEVHDWQDYQADGLSEQRSESGRIGGLTRALNAERERAAELEERLQSLESKQTQANAKQPQAGVLADEQATSKHGPDPEPVPAPEEPTLDGTADADPVEDGPTFDEWWDAYRDVARGRPTGYGNRKPAERAWKALTRSQQADAVEAVPTYARLLALEDAARTSPYPAQHGSTWLNQQTFADVAQQLADRQAPTATARGSAPTTVDKSRYCGCGQRLDQHDARLCEVAA